MSWYPKKIYMCDKTYEFIEKYSQNWKKLNPDFEIELFDDEKCIQFLQDNYGSIYVDIFKYIPDGPIKADFWRLCILFKKGGIYIDADNEPIVPLHNFLEPNVDFITCSSYHKNGYYFNPNFIVCKPDNIFIKEAINIYLKLYENHKDDYTYLGWSIMDILSKAMPIKYYSRKEGIYKLKKHKIQIIEERPGKNHWDAHNMYKGVRVFNNRYASYDANNHKFSM